MLRERDRQRCTTVVQHAPAPRLPYISTLACSIGSTVRMPVFMILAVPLSAASAGSRAPPHLLVSLWPALPSAGVSVDLNQAPMKKKYKILDLQIFRDLRPRRETQTLEHGVCACHASMMVMAWCNMCPCAGRKETAAGGRTGFHVFTSLACAPAHCPLSTWHGASATAS